jgi:hypothetical protein
VSAECVTKDRDSFLGLGYGLLAWERSGNPMNSAAECMAFAAECQRLGTAPETSIQRASILLAMSRSWSNLAADIERYDVILQEENDAAG